MGSLATRRGIQRSLAFAWLACGALLALAGPADARPDPTLATTSTVHPLAHSPGISARGSLSCGGVTAAVGRHRVMLRAGSTALSLSTVSLSRGHVSRRLPPGLVSSSDGRITCRRPGLDEWYASGQGGIEQGFTVTRRPTASGGTFTLNLRSGGSLAPVKIDSRVLFLTPGGRTALVYGNLRAWDAEHRALPARLVLRGRLLSLIVADRAAHYPITIDPVIQQGGKLIGDGWTTYPRFGEAVAISADGTTLLIGGSGDNAAWVYTRTSEGWTQQGGKIAPSEGSWSFGSAVALSGDGNTALIGAPRDALDVGTAWIFVRAGGVWYEQAQLYGPSATGAGFGSSVALSADGSTALVGAPDERYIALGTAYVFSRNTFVWTQDDRFVGQTDYFGSSVALSADGSTALIGGPVTNGGSVQINVRSNWVWQLQALDLTPSDEVGEGYFGSSVALSADGDTALIGGPADSGSVGAAWIFSRSGDTWTQNGAKLTANDEQYSGRFGSAVSLSSSGGTALIGGEIDDSQVGAAWMFSDATGAWTQRGGKLTAGDETGQGLFGHSVSLSGDGRTAVIGAPQDNGAFPDFVGGAWVFFNDTTRPRAWVKPASGLRYHTVLLRYRFTDRDDTRVLGVKIRVKNGRGNVVARFTYDHRRTGVWYAQKWLVRVRRGTYRFFVSARDRAGNQSKVAVGRITVS